jgi:SAM-dependent methyltransferase
VTIPTNPDPLLDYLSMAPLPLAFERALEARIFSTLVFDRPVLDIGCGDGLFARIVFGERIDTGIDPNRRELQRASELGAYHELIECFGDAVPKPDGTYRTIFSNSVLEHIENLEPVIREAHRLLAPEGRLYVTVPTDRFERLTAINRTLEGLRLDNVARRYRRFYNTFWRHYHCLSPQGWLDLMRGCGFEVVAWHTYDPPSVCLLNDLLVPFSAPGALVKRVTNRWTLFPPVRRAVLRPVYRGVRRLLERGTRAEDGGLVFLSLRKAP